MPPSRRGGPIAMPSHKSHGHEYVEPPRHDELPDGVVVTPAPTGHEKTPDGRFAPGCTELARRGGSRSKGTTKLSHKIVGAKLTEQSVRRARTLRKAITSEIARGVGGGYCGIAASLFIKYSAQKSAAAEEAFERGDFELFRKLSESARMDILYAREHAAKEAVARKAAAGGDPSGLLFESHSGESEER